jgi:predicted dehydrogenase/glycine/D-amino acid oxidase-like deaminating enzyme
MPPRILLIGAGRFGREHLAEWRRLDAQCEVTLAGVVTTRDVGALLGPGAGVAVHAALTDALLRDVDAVDIVTPPHTHAALVRRCLPFVHVLVEKPLATSPEEAADLVADARRHGRVLAVGHLFRFHPVVYELARVVSARPDRPRGIHGRFINLASERAGRDAAHLEFLHLFDIVDALFGVEPEAVVGRPAGEVTHVSVRYPGPMTACFEMGWRGTASARTLELVYADGRVVADFVDGTVTLLGRHNQLERRVCPPAPSALHDQLQAFVRGIADPPGRCTTAEVGARIVGVATRAAPRAAPLRPRVAVIGGGIFGASCAIELSRLGEVTLFERYDGLMTEASRRHQWRHHTGFHYPRSFDTVVEILAARTAFEQEYGAAIDRSSPAYYCTSASGIEIPAERFLAACRYHGLTFDVVAPPGDLVDAARVSVCVKTDEGVYDLPRLQQVIAARLQAASVNCRFRTEVTSVRIDGSGLKHVTQTSPDGTREEAFDYLVNATYGHRNRLAHWLGLPIAPLRFDLFEMLALDLPVPRASVTVLDGPFTTLVGTGPGSRFLLAHIHASVARSTIPEDGLQPRWPAVVSNRANILRHAARYLPVVMRGTDVESVWVTRAVEAYARDFDARPTVVTPHGFGCWSVLAGKIVTCVSNAREIAQAIVAEQGGHGRRLEGLPRD